MARNPRGLLSAMFLHVLWLELAIIIFIAMLLPHAYMYISPIASYSSYNSIQCRGRWICLHVGIVDILS